MADVRGLAPDVVGDPAPRVPAGRDGAEHGVVERGVADLGLLGQQVAGLAEERYLGPDEWAALAEEREGSWWPEWVRWLGEHSGRVTKPPPMGQTSTGYQVLGDAPGEYVMDH